MCICLFYQSIFRPFIILCLFECYNNNKLLDRLYQSSYSHRASSTTVFEKDRNKLLFYLSGFYVHHNIDMVIFSCTISEDKE